MNYNLNQKTMSKKFMGKIITGRAVTTSECGPPPESTFLKPAVAKKITVQSPTKFPEKRKGKRK